MELLRELVSIQRMDDQPPTNDQPDQKTTQYHDDDILNMLQQPGEDLDQEDTSDLEGVVDQATEDPDRQGLIRNVKNAHLVYKRQDDDGTYEELWAYKVGSLRDELDIRKAILAGTDIPINQMQSPDGKQVYHLWSSGNIEMLHIKGLPN